MRIGPFTRRFNDAAIVVTKALPPLSPLETRGGWFPIIRESYTGAWQSNVEVTLTDVLTHPTVYACLTLISSDIAKMRLRLVESDGNGIWTETENPAYSPVLRKPNHYQTQFKFVEQWVLSKLIHGNAYMLKERDNRNVVVALYVLDPNRVTPLVAPDGSVYYQLNRDDLSSQPQEIITVPASEIIHDVMAPLYHPLVGKSPLIASGVAATLGLRILENSSVFFTNGSRPGGILIAPGAISQTNADRMKAYWETNFSGANIGKVAVLSDNMKYEPMAAVHANDAQLTEQWSKVSEAIASTFHVPFHLVGGPPPPYNNIQALTVQYYSQCIHSLTVQIESSLDKGLSLQSPLGTEFDVDDLLWMDSATMMQTIRDGVTSGVLTPNEARARLGYKPVEGGDTPYLQQQDHSLASLAARDESAPAAGAAVPAPEPAPAESPDEDEEKAWDLDVLEAMARGLATKKLDELVAA